MGDLLILIEADCNDGDYSLSAHSFDYSILETVKKVIEAIKKAPLNPRWGTRHNWETEERSDDATPQKLYVDTGILTEEEVEIFNRYVPAGGENYPGIHTIKSVEIVEVIDKLL